MSGDPVGQPPVMGVADQSVRRRGVVGVVVIVLLWAGGIAGVTRGLRVPTYVEQVTVDNPHLWQANVDVTGRDGAGWVGLGTVERESRSTFHDVVDQGDTWVFTFGYAGQDAEVRVSRSELERADWQITVPDQLAEQLRTAGVPETPP